MHHKGKVFYMTLIFNQDFLRNLLSKMSLFIQVFIEVFEADSIKFLNVLIVYLYVAIFDELTHHLRFFVIISRFFDRFSKVILELLFR